MKKTIITVVGKDTVGIIAGVCSYLAENNVNILDISCLLYTSDAADEEDSVDLGGRRILKKKNRRKKN